MTLFDYLLNDFNDYLHLLEWLSYDYASLVRMNFLLGLHVHLLEWLSMTTFNCKNDFTGLASLVRMTLCDYFYLFTYLHLLEWLCLTIFTC